MSGVHLLESLACRDVLVTRKGETLSVDAPTNTLTDDDIGALRENKVELMRLLRLADGHTGNESDEVLFECEDIEVDSVPICDSCNRYCDIQTLSDRWRCSHCDPDASNRRQRTRELLLRKTKILNERHREASLFLHAKV